MKKLHLLFLLLLSSFPPHPLEASPMIEEKYGGTTSEQDSSRSSDSITTTTERNRRAASAPITSRSSIMSRGTSLAIATPQTSVLLPIETAEYCEFLNAVLPADRRAFFMTES
ncbi:MAG: hypothetical protein K2W97_06235 [Chthoniobacterales bacterium]|nr:hypothetical protein [Chthoniobacterales bacterium]